MSDPRYIVKPVRGMCMGAGGFLVVDTVQGEEFIGTLRLWKDDAQKIADRWNAQDRALQDDVGGDRVL